MINEFEIRMYWTAAIKARQPQRRTYPLALKGVAIDDVAAISLHSANAVLRRLCAELIDGPEPALKRTA
jgi:hypothetical protein